MSIDKLQDKIRKLKCPLAVDLSVLPEHIPPHVLEAAGDFPRAYKQFCKELLEGLRESVPAVRFNFSSFALLGSEGLDVLEELLDLSKKLGYYILLDGAELLSARNLTFAADLLFDRNGKWYFDGLIVTAYTGSDAIRPYVSKLPDSDKDLFVVARTSNKTAAEIQDLLSGSRLTHTAMAEVVNRYAASTVGRCGYSNVAVMAAASAPDSLRALRAKFKNIFLLLDGCDYPTANAKYCSYAFDKLGHGALACAGLSVTAAWQDELEPTEYVACAVRSVERLKKNFSRYVTVL